MYMRVVFDIVVDETLKVVCLEIEIYGIFC